MYAIMEQNSSTMDRHQSMRKNSYEVTESAVARLCEWRGSNEDSAGRTWNGAGQTVYHKRKEERNEQEKRIHAGI